MQGNDNREPDGDLGDTLKDVARIIKSGLGVQAVTLDVGNWDMHAGLSPSNNPRAGWMYDQLVELVLSLPLDYRFKRGVQKPLLAADLALHDAAGARTAFAAAREAGVPVVTGDTSQIDLPRGSYATVVMGELTKSGGELDEAGE